MPSCSWPTKRSTTMRRNVKDIEIGLVDWPAMHEGREVLLCGKYGEREVASWHERDAGFAGRRPVAELRDQ
jgi:hypothetical protein